MRGVARVRKIPQRTCIACRAVRPKRELMRVVRGPDGSVFLDPTGKKSGRGAYVCPDPACLREALKGQRLERALETTLDPGAKDRLTEELERTVIGRGGRPEGVD